MSSFTSNNLASVCVHSLPSGADLAAVLRIFRPNNSIGGPQSDIANDIREIVRGAKTYIVFYVASAARSFVHQHHEIVHTVHRIHSLLSSTETRISEAVFVLHEDIGWFLVATGHEGGPSVGFIGCSVEIVDAHVIGELRDSNRGSEGRIKSQ